MRERGEWSPLTVVDQRLGLVEGCVGEGEHEAGGAGLEDRDRGHAAHGGQDGARLQGLLTHKYV